MTSREIGNLGEDYTASFLVSRGAKILERNYTVRGGEIDIIAQKGIINHFVEDKTRKKNPLTTGGEAITPAKIARIIHAAKSYICQNGIELSSVFDVALVEVSLGRVTGFEYIQRAFCE